MANPGDVPSFQNSSAQRSFAAEPYDSVAAVLASKQITAALAGSTIFTKDGYTYQVAAANATDHHVTTVGGAKLYVLPGLNGYSVKAFGATGDGVANDTSALKAMILRCIESNTAGYITSGTYVVSLGELVFDNGHVNKPFPMISTDGNLAVKFKAAENEDLPFITITNGTATSANGNFWQGGGLGSISFEPAAGSVSGMPGMNGLVLRGIEDADFGFMSAAGIGGDTIHIERSLFGGSNPDPYHVNRCRFEGVSGVGNHGRTITNNNYRGFAFNEIGNVFANGNSNGCVFGLGAGNSYASIGAAFCGGWAVGEQGNSTGGASNSVTIGNIEIDNCQYGIDTQNISEGLEVDNVKIVHRYNQGLNASLEEGYWPRIALRIGSSFRSVRDIYFNSVEDRIESGGTLADLGVLADFVNAGASLRGVYISRNVADNGGVGLSPANYASNFNKNSYNVFYRTPRASVIDTTKMGSYVRARNSGSVAIPNSGFGGSGNWVAYDTLMEGAVENYSVANREYTVPSSGLYRIRATLALTLPAGTKVRMGIYADTSLAFSNFSYAATADAQTHVIEGTVYLSIGQKVKISADQNSAGAVATGGTTGGVNDSYLSVEML